jgi:hypothetical protein
MAVHEKNDAKKTTLRNDTKERREKNDTKERREKNDTKIIPVSFQAFRIMTDHTQTCQ